MRSFAVWYSLKQPPMPNKEVTIHVNLWDKDNKDLKKYCFDFGLLIEDIRGIDHVYLYCPFELSRDQIKDLGRVISDNSLVNAIFNENYTTTDGEPKRLIVNPTTEKPGFVIYALEIDSQITLATCKRNFSTPGTIIEIKINNIQCTESSRYYFRVRIEVPRKDIHMIHDEIKGVSIFSNHFTNTEVIDFRLNDIRSCSQELREQFNKGHRFRILAIHYLILRNANDIIIHHGKELASRMLENDLWNKYIDGSTHNIIAYHLKSKAVSTLDSSNNKIYKYVDDFSALTRFQYEKETSLIILLYIAAIILLGSIGGVLGNFFSKLVGI